MLWMEMDEFLQWEWVKGSTGVVLHSNRAVQALSRFPKRNMVVGQKVIHWNFSIVLIHVYVYVYDWIVFFVRPLCGIGNASGSKLFHTCLDFKGILDLTNQLCESIQITYSALMMVPSRARLQSWSLQCFFQMSRDTIEGWGDLSARSD